MEPCDLLETRSSLHYANKSKLGFVEAASFQRNWGGPPLEVQILYTFPTPKMGIKQIEQFSDIILRILRFLAESSGVAKLELFQRFPHCKWVSAGVPTPPDSGKIPQLKTSKLAQNCGKTEVLHL